MSIDPPRRLFRIVTADPPPRRDLMSYEQLGIVPRRPLTPRDRDRRTGVSHHDSLQAAVNKARESPHLGSYVAEILIPTGIQVRIEQTGRDQTHFTVWASCDQLLSWVRSVTSVADVQ